MNKRRGDDRDNLNTERDLRNKLTRGQEERWRADPYRGGKPEGVWDKGKGSINTDIHCFNCNQSGHYQKDCRNPPYCYGCKKNGHKTSYCSEKRGLRVCGFGILGQGFYSIRLPNNKTEAKKGLVG